MEKAGREVETLLVTLKERAKELNCLYAVEELFNKPDTTLDGIMQGIVLAMPAGWQYPEICQAKITYGGNVFTSPGFRETPWVMSGKLRVQDEVVGEIAVSYREERPAEAEGPFLKEERRLLDTIGERMERRIFHERLKQVFESRQTGAEEGGEWAVILDLLRRTDPKLLARIGRKMLNVLSTSGIEEADALRSRAVQPEGDLEHLTEPVNRPSTLLFAGDDTALHNKMFTIAARHLGEREVLNSIQKWIVEDRSSFLVKILEDPASSLTDIAGAIGRFHHLASHGLRLPASREQGVRVSLIRRLLSDDIRYLGVAKQFIDTEMIHALLRNTIVPAGSHGKLGGKASGLILASEILRKSPGANDLTRRIRVPKTWFLASDGILSFISHNDLEDIVEKKYEDIAQVRVEYPSIVHLFKSSPLPPDIVNGLSVALDDLGEVPLIVRSSSLLEDRVGTSFAGKYKSLFIANQGSKRERLTALIDAISEVYASTFSPDPIEYRMERGMIDLHEEMGILIQEVVGCRVGNYFIPAFAGVAFSENEFRWSPRISREDGLIRIVPGLGTRAVDRVSEDYPILIAPRQPQLRVNVSLEEKIRYSPKHLDVINLASNTFETIDLRELLKEAGESYPLAGQVFSILRNDRLTVPGGLGIDYEHDNVVVTFDGLFAGGTFLDQIGSALRVLKTELATAVDLEFAHDGSELYLLQCRAQSHAGAMQPASIPKGIRNEDILFTAKRLVTSGLVQSQSYIVYVDPQEYGEVASLPDLLAVGRAVSRLNQLLPKRTFLLMGPGRWGSRGDIRLGVSVTYSDINNASMLIEIARKKKGYMPEPSFGTHFFQDLVEASIRYLPLFPDDPDVIFREEFLKNAENLLPGLLPEFEHLANVVRVVDIPASTGGKTLSVLMNGEENEAVAVLTSPAEELTRPVARTGGGESAERREDSHWRWRLNAAEHIAANLDPQRFGVKAVYLFGSTKNATAGPQSDIDLLVHFAGTDDQRRALEHWFEGWSLCLSEVNRLRTGFRTAGLLDLHIITDADIAQRTSWASKLGLVTDAPRMLRTGGAPGR
jgi:hypothetical protein